MFQWPEPAYCIFPKNNPAYYKYKPKKLDPSLEKINKIETFFKKKYKSKFAILFPSGRAAINQILIFKGINRSKIVNVPLWTSSCLLHALTAITNVTVKNTKADSLIIVHKWGITYKIKKSISLKKSLIIEDSADSFPRKSYRPFENNSNYEMISLPKLLGSFCGGIILTNNQNFYTYAKTLQIKNKTLANKQSLRKFISAFKDNKNADWRFYESLNHSLDYNSVENIYGCLPNYKINLRTIIRREKLIKTHFKNIFTDKKRVGPCIIFDGKKFDQFKSLLEKKHFDVNKNVVKENFKKCFIFPIHFGIPENSFKNLFNSLIKISK